MGVPGVEAGPHKRFRGWISVSGKAGRNLLRSISPQACTTGLQPVIVALLIVFGTASQTSAQQPDPDAAVPDAPPEGPAPEIAPEGAADPDAAVPLPEEPVLGEEAALDPDAGVPLEEEVVEEEVVAGRGGHARKLAARAVNNRLAQAAKFRCH